MWLQQNDSKTGRFLGKSQREQQIINYLYVNKWRNGERSQAQKLALKNA